MQMLSMNVALFCEMRLLLNGSKEIADFNSLGIILTKALLFQAMILLHRCQLHSLQGETKLVEGLRCGNSEVK